VLLSRPRFATPDDPDITLLTAGKSLVRPGLRRETERSRGDDLQRTASLALRISWSFMLLNISQIGNDTQVSREQPSRLDARASKRADHAEATEKTVNG